MVADVAVVVVVVDVVVVGDERKNKVQQTE